MNEILRTARYAVEVPQALRDEFEKYKNKWSPYGPSIQVRQETVDGFTALTGDDNPIHRASAQKPIVPGFLTVALMPKLFGRELPMQVPGRQLLNAGFTCRFVRPVPIGAEIKMRYRGLPLTSDRLNVKASFEFEVVLSETKKNVVEGLIHLYLV